ncbi:hypothetical protein DSO57_1012555 [Entomophthora muscae]|uniref:Uncharacterized protein n=1 Tax=Entomophthora muscae TaxID=34485 RepID=A0ACC2TH60_9FUNG|nr:hypothetical protein DSO57_1012555 [Entomophthora muscae]
MDQLPFELIQLVLAKVHLETIPAVMQVCCAWRKVALELIQKELKSYSINISFNQKTTLNAQLLFSHIDTSLYPIFTSCGGHSGDFYPSLIRSPSSKAITLIKEGSKTEIKRNIHLRLTKNGIVTYSGKDFTFQYAVQKGLFGDRTYQSVTPLSFRCPLILLLHSKPPKPVTKKPLFHPQLRLLCLIR